MSFSMVVPAQLSEWGWLFGFALVSLALVALAVLADALYEGYRERMSRARHPLADAEAEGDEQRAPSRGDESKAPGKKAA